MKKVITKHKLNDLGNELIQFIKQRTNLFNTIKIVVPDKLTSEWFKTYWINNESDVLMNVSFETIDEALLNIIPNDSFTKLLKIDQLRTLIIKSLSESNQTDLPVEISKYIYDDKVINQIKLFDLANEFAKLFYEYEKDLVTIKDWQLELYNTVLLNAKQHNLSTLSYLYHSNSYLKENSQPLYFFGFNKFDKLEEKIIDNYSLNSDVYLLVLEEDLNYKEKFYISAAPSKLREIESVHSKICNLLLDENIKYSDFLVVSSNISEYEDIIPRVFKQDNEKFPNIPYVINGYKKIQSNISIALKTLIDIANKQFFTRFDFYNLISNVDVQSARGISMKEVDSWSKYLIDINVYRSTETRDDWDYAKKRILLSKVSGVNDIDNNLVELNNNEYLPFSTIEFDDDSIVRFCSVIDDLNEWLHFTRNTSFINNDNIGKFTKELEKWFSVKDINEYETNKQFNKLKKHLDFWCDIDLPCNKIPRNTLFYSLIECSKATVIKTGECFTKGITFSDFDPNAIISSKFVFFLNTSSSVIPISYPKSELDQRDYDISNIKEVETAFNILYQNADKFYISYVNKNLKTDEDFYPSTLINKLKKRINVPTENISLDETRDWKELYTKNAYVNKKYYDNLLNVSTESNVEHNEETCELVKKVRLNDLSSFLEEPLKNKATYLFGREDITDEEIKDEYEPFGNDLRIKSVLVRKIAVELLIKKPRELSLSYFNNLRKRYNLERKLPNINDSFNKVAFESILQDCSSILQNIYAKTDLNYEVIKLNDITIDVNSNQVVLTCHQECCVSRQNNEITYFGIKQIEKGVTLSTFMYPYVFSLAHVSTLEEQEYNIILDMGERHSFLMTPTAAKELLTKIYLHKFDYHNNYFIPLNHVSKKKNETFNDLLKSFDDNIWAYFDHAKLFDYESQLGFTFENFDNVFKTIVNNHLQLIAFIELKDDGDENGN